MNKNRYYEPKTGHVYQWLVTDAYPHGAMFVEHKTSGNVMRIVVANRNITIPFHHYPRPATKQYAIKLLGLKPLPSTRWRTGSPKVAWWYATKITTWSNDQCAGRYGWRTYENGRWSNGADSTSPISSVSILANIDSLYKIAEVEHCLFWPEWARVPPPVGYFEQ